MGDANQVDIFDEIQSFCREFRKRLKAGQSASMDQYLTRVDGSARNTLFQNLLHLEIEFRRRRGENPTSEGYIKRFPQYARMIRQAFFESTMMSQEFAGDTPDSDTPTVTLGMPAARKLGDYELLRELGRGGFGVVYEARHLQRGDRVALKTLPMSLDGQPESSRDAERLHRFRREFRSLSEINHPNLAGMQSLEVDGNQWFFTMDLINGVDFLQYVRPLGKLDEQRLRASLKQLVRGIIALHEQGIVHRDLKPSNVLVGTDGHLTILDFGLVAELQHFAGETLSIGTKHFAGTPRYAAPEQASGQRGASVDWYALGVMLYEAITGDAPFKGSGVDLLIAKQTTDPPALSGKEGGPTDLAELVDAMLRREPGDRPGDQQVADAMGIHAESTTHDSSSAESSLVDDSASLSDHFLVGRERQLAELDERLSQFASSGQPEAVFISGRSGEGKTSLVESFLSGVRRDGKMLVLAGRCYDRESVPFKAIDCLIDPLVAYLRAQGIDELDKVLPDDIGMLAKLFPVLRRVESIADRTSTLAASIDSRQIRYRAFAAFRELLTAVGRSRPVVLFIDDLQWGDADSAAALHEVLRGPNSPAVLLLGSYRSDEADSSQFLTEWRELQSDDSSSIAQREIEVAPLTEEECVLLIASRLGIAPETLREQSGELFQDTRGNPYFVEQLIEGFDPSFNSFRAVALEELIERKLARLPPAAKTLLETVAIAGQAASIEEVAAVAGESGSAFSNLTHMRSERLVRLVGSDERQLVDTYHDKIRETVLQAMEEPQQRRQHLKFAEFLEQPFEGDASEPEPMSGTKATHPRVHDLAYHFFEAGDERAFRYQLASGKAALNEYAMEIAFERLHRAIHLTPPDLDSLDQFELQFSLAEAQRGLGRSDECRERYDSAKRLAPDELSRARCEYGIGSSYVKQGEAGSAIRHFNRGLAHLGAPVPKSALGDLWGIVANLTRFHFTPKWMSEWNGRDSESAEHDRLVASTLALYPYINYSNTFRWLNSFTRLLVIGRQSKDIRVKGLAYGWYTAFFMLHGWTIPGYRYLRKVKELAAETRSQDTKAILDHFSGAEYLAGDITSAIAYLKSCTPELKRIQHYLYPMTFHWLRHIYSLQGNTEQIIEAASQERKCGESTGDNITIAYGLYGLADGLSRRGEFDRAVEFAKEAVDRLTRAQILSVGVAYQELGRAQLQASDYTAAFQTLEESRRFIVRNLLLNEAYLDMMSLHTEAILGDRWVLGPGDIVREKQTAAARSARRARLLCARFPTLRAHCYRVSGRAAFACGKVNKALKYFDKAISAAEKIGARYEWARALIDKSVLPNPNAESDRRRGLQMLRELDSVLPVAEQNYLS